MLLQLMMTYCRRRRDIQQSYHEKELPGKEKEKVRRNDSGIFHVLNDQTLTFISSGKSLTLSRLSRPVSFSTGATVIMVSA